MSGALADAMGERLEPLTDGYNECEWDRRAVDPISAEALGLKTGVWRYLEEVRGEHRVLMRSDALRVVRRRERSGVRVFDDLQLVLLIFVEKTIKSRGMEF